MLQQGTCDRVDRMLAARCDLQNVWRSIAGMAAPQAEAPPLPTKHPVLGSWKTSEPSQMPRYAPASPLLLLVRILAAVLASKLLLVCIPLLPQEAQEGLLLGRDSAPQCSIQRDWLALIPPALPGVPLAQNPAYLHPLSEAF